MDDRNTWLRSQLVDVSEIPRRELPTDPVWCGEVLKRLKALQMTQTELAAWVGTVQSQISQMLTGKLARCEFVERTARALKLEMPPVARIELSLAALSALDDYEGLRFVANNAEYTAGRAAGLAAPQGPPAPQDAGNPPAVAPTTPLRVRPARAPKKSS